MSKIDDGILLSIKKLLGISEEDSNFDSDLIIHINSVFLILNQLGIGPAHVFFISGIEETWKDFTSDINEYSLVRTYIYLKVKLIFDPPLTSSVLQSYESQIKEYEWRLNVATTEVEVQEEEDTNYSEEYEVTAKAFDKQILNTSGKKLKEDIVINQVPYYETTNRGGGVTSYIAKE